MTIKLLTEHHLESLSLKGGYTGSSESTLVKMPHFLKSREMAHMCNVCNSVNYISNFQSCDVLINVIYLLNIIYV